MHTPLKPRLNAEAMTAIKRFVLSESDRIAEFALDLAEDHTIPPPDFELDGDDDDDLGEDLIEVQTVILDMILAQIRREL